MSYADPFNAPFSYAKSVGSQDVPGRFMAAVGGHSYMIDLAKFSRRSVPAIRQQSDQSSEPGEQSLSASDLWRRSQSTWDGGTGQQALDLADSVRSRFSSSKGVNPWVKGQLSLLSDTEAVYSFTDYYPILATCGAYLYIAYGPNLAYRLGGGSWTFVGGLPVQTIRTLTSDGYNLYIGYGSAAGIYTSVAGTTTSAVWSTWNADRLAFVKNRLIGSLGRNLYNFKTGTTRTDLTPLFLPPDWLWLAFGEAPTFILAAGYSGESSMIFRTTIQPEGTDLTAPVAAASLPDGESPAALSFYQDFVFIGTSLGVRIARIDSSGSLSFGALVRTTSPVFCFEPQGEFVWFGWTNYDSTSTGLGRIDLRTFFPGMRPAYASDVMAAAQGTVRSVVMYNGLIHFAIDAWGVMRESTSKVPAGSLVTGNITYGLTDPKVFYYASVRHQPLPDQASVAVQLTVDGGTPLPEILSLTKGSTGFASEQAALGAKTGTFGSLTITLRRGFDPATTPTLLLWNLRAWPVPRRSEEIVLPLILADALLDLGETETRLDVLQEFYFLKTLEKVGAPVQVQIGSEGLEGFIDGVELSSVYLSGDLGKLQGVCSVLIRRFE